MTEHDEKHLKVYEAVYGNVLSTEQIQQLHNFTKDLGISADQEDGPKQQAEDGAQLQLRVVELYRMQNELVSAHTDLLVQQPPNIKKMMEEYIQQRCIYPVNRKTEKRKAKRRKLKEEVKRIQ